MSNEIIVAIISGLCVAIPSIIATLVNIRKNNDLVIFRLNQLDQKVHEHNNLIDRMYKAESNIELLNEKMADLEKSHIWHIIKIWYNNDGRNARISKKI